jgi:hypothetical protein
MLIAGISVVALIGVIAVCIRYTVTDRDMDGY